MKPDREENRNPDCGAPQPRSGVVPFEPGATASREAPNKQAYAPSMDFLRAFAEGPGGEPEEMRFISALEGIGFELEDGKLKLTLPVEVEILVYPDIDGEDGWTGAAARLRVAGGQGSLESISGSYPEVRDAIDGWLRRIGRSK